MKRPCSNPVCNNLVGSGYCDDCQSDHNSRDKETYDRTDPELYKSRRWRRLRLIKLRRDPTCETQTCSRQAEEVDHITPISQCGEKFDLDNLQSLCSECHTRKTDSEIRDRKSGTPDVTLIAGPPCSGKSTYVKHHIPNDWACFEKERIEISLRHPEQNTRPDGFFDVSEKLRETVLEFCRTPSVLGGVAIVEMAPDYRRREWYEEELDAEVVVLDPGMEACLNRARQRENPHQNTKTIRDWYSVFVPRSSDTIIEGFEVNS